MGTPANPTKISRIDQPRCFAISQNKNTLAIYFDNSIELYDVTDPASPTPLGKWTEGDFGNDEPQSVDMALGDSCLALLYSIQFEHDNFPSDVLHAIDIRDTHNPYTSDTLIVTPPISATRISLPLKVVGSTLYYGQVSACVGSPQSDLETIDISNPTDVKGVLSQFVTGVLTDFSLYKNRCYTVHYGDWGTPYRTMSVLSIPDRLATIGEYNGGGSISVLSVEGNRAVVACDFQVWLLDITKRLNLP